MGETNFGRYQLVKKLAAGGMAEVFLAKQEGLEGFQKLLVVKRILPHLAHDDEFVEMFLNEARIAARFNHANIVQIYDLGKIGDSYFIAMEYVHGEDLGKLMRKAWNMGKWVPMPLALRVVAMACEGLFYAHNKTDEAGQPLQVVHRDISPQNILISFDGGVKVVDFGIARAAGSASLTKSGTIKGKYAYMSPEQAEGKSVDCRADIFAIGLVLYELLTGVRPLKRDSDIVTLQAALACQIEPPSKVAQVPENLDAVVMKALARRREDRYQTAQEFQLALENHLVQKKLSASSVQIAELMKTLFKERLEEEARLGRPDPSGRDSHVSIPALRVSKRGRSNDEDAPEGRVTAPSPAGEGEDWEAPAGVDDPSLDRPARGSRKADSSSTRSRPGSARSDVRRASVADDSAEMTEEAKPVKRSTTSDSRRRVSEISGGGASRSKSTAGLAMPEAPPRRATTSVPVNASWKVSSAPVVAREDTDRGHRKPASARWVALVLLAGAGGAGYAFRGQIQKALAAPDPPPAAPKPSLEAHPIAVQGMGRLNLDANLTLSVMVNGEAVGETPLRNAVVKAGTDAVRLYSEGQGVDRTITLDVPEGGEVSHHEEFNGGRVLLKLDRSDVSVEVYVGKTHVGTAPGPLVMLSEGDHELDVRNDGMGLVGKTRVKVLKDKIVPVSIHLHGVHASRDDDEVVPLP